jgi:Acetyltransferase (GNAT) family
MGYVLGKAEGEGKLWHGHVSAVTVSPEYRRLGLAHTLMNYFETLSIQQYNAYFVDLFVRASNRLAIDMYTKFGYVSYRRVLGYYSGELPEDAWDMRKALPRYVCVVCVCVCVCACIWALSLVHPHMRGVETVRSSNLLRLCILLYPTRLMLTLST